MPLVLSNMFDTNAHGTALRDGLHISEDGTKYYTLYDAHIREITCLNVWGGGGYISQASTYVWGDYGLSYNPENGCIFLPPDGGSAYLKNANTNKIEKYTLGTDWTFTNGMTLAGSALYDVAGGLDGSPTEHRLYCANYSDEILEISMATPGDLATASQTYAADLSAVVGDLLDGGSSSGYTSGLCVSQDGTEIYIVRGRRDVHKLVMSAWDLSTVSWSEYVFDFQDQADLYFREDFGSTDGNIYGIKLSPDKTKVILHAEDINDSTTYAMIYDVTSGEFWTQFHGQEEIK